MSNRKLIDRETLESDLYFIHYHLMVVCFGSVQTRILKEKQGRIIDRGRYKYFVDNELVIKTNYDFLRITDEMLLYCYLLKKFMRKVYELKVDYKYLKIDISFKEITEVLGIKTYRNKTHYGKFKDMFFRLRELTLNFNYKNMPDDIIAGLVDDAKYKYGKGAKTTYEVKFSEGLFDALSLSTKIFNRKVFFDPEEFKSIETDGAKKLFLYFKSFGGSEGSEFRIDEFKRVTLERVLGHVGYYYKDGEVVEERCRDKLDTAKTDEERKYKKKSAESISKNDLGRYLNILVKCKMEIKGWKYIKERDVYKVFYIINSKLELSDSDLLQIRIFEKNVSEDYDWYYSIYKIWAREDCSADNLQQFNSLANNELLVKEKLEDDGLNIEERLFWEIF